MNVWKTQVMYTIQPQNLPVSLTHSIFSIIYGNLTNFIEKSTKPFLTHTSFIGD